MKGRRKRAREVLKIDVSDTETHWRLSGCRRGGGPDRAVRGGRGCRVRLQGVQTDPMSEDSAQFRLPEGSSRVA